MFSIWPSMSYWISFRGCVGFFGDAVLFIEGSRYVVLILFEEGLYQFSLGWNRLFGSLCYYWW
jgi:hypothetical protein